MGSRFDRGAILQQAIFGTDVAGARDDSETTRVGDWCQTFTGRKSWPLDPRPGDFDVRDIAHALSMRCRYGGMTTRFFSVAQHSIMVAALCPAWCQLEGLLHDASEAYLDDIRRPLKLTRAMTAYREAEALTELAIARQFGLVFPWPEPVKAADQILLETERRDLMVAGPAWRKWCGRAEPLPDPIHPWDWSRAEMCFLATYQYYLENRGLSS